MKENIRGKFLENSRKTFLQTLRQQTFILGNFLELFRVEITKKIRSNCEETNFLLMSFNLYKLLFTVLFDRGNFH